MEGTCYFSLSTREARLRGCSPASPVPGSLFDITIPRHSTAWGGVFLRTSSGDGSVFRSGYIPLYAALCSSPEVVIPDGRTFSLKHDCLTVWVHDKMNNIGIRRCYALHQFLRVADFMKNIWQDQDIMTAGVFRCETLDSGSLDGCLSDVFLCLSGTSQTKASCGFLSSLTGTRPTQPSFLPTCPGRISWLS